MENRKKKTMETDHYLRTIKQNYKDNVVDCYRFFTDGLKPSHIKSKLSRLRRGRF